MSKVLVISTSLRAKSNSDILTERLIAGAKDALYRLSYSSIFPDSFCIIPHGTEKVKPFLGFFRSFLPFSGPIPCTA